MGPAAVDAIISDHLGYQVNPVYICVLSGPIGEAIPVNISS